MARIQHFSILPLLVLFAILRRMENRYGIKAIAIDLDGTLLTTEKIITDRTIQTLRHVMDNGIHVSIATGRSLTTASRFIEQVGTKFPAVCYNGSCIYDPSNNKDLWHIALDSSICKRIVDISLTSPAHLHAFQEHELYFTENGRNADYLEPLSGKTGKAIDFSKLSPLRFTKAMFIGERTETDRIQSLLKNEFGSTLHLVYSHADYFEIMTGGATKGSALERLMDMYGIHSDQVMAFGDADNDKEMLTWAKFGIAMGNAHETIKSVASDTATHNDDDGVAKKIQEIMGFQLPD